MKDLRNTSWPFKVEEIHKYAFWEKAFSVEECEVIKSVGKQKGLIRGTIFKQENLNNNYRDSEISWLYPSDNLEFVFKKITDVITNLNQQFFKFELFGLIEGLQFTNYQAPGGKYGRHTDRGFSCLIRKLSVSIQLDDPNNYEGGDLILYESEEGVSMKKEQGTVVVFPSYVMHEVTPVTKGERNSLVAWVTGPSFK